MTGRSSARWLFGWQWHAESVFRTTRSSLICGRRVPPTFRSSGCESWSIASGRPLATRRTPSTGYALDASPVDLIAVEALVTELAAARRAGVQASADRIDEAPRHWHEPALADLRAFPGGASEGTRLDALHLSLRTESIELKLAEGRNDSAELEHRRHNESASVRR